MSATNPYTDTVHASTTSTGVETDGNGDVTVTVSDLRTIESAADVTASATGGYVANVQSVSGNQVTVRIFEDAGAAGALAPVTGTAGVTDVHVTAVGN